MISNLPDDAQHKHKNGGGWVANTTRIDESVYIGPHALAYGNVELTGKVCLLDSSQVSGNVKLGGDVIVSGNCWLDGTFKANTGRFWKNERVQTKQERIR